jgi:nitroreductase
LFNCPCLIVFHSRPDISSAEANINLALQNATLIAHSLNLGGFFTGYVVSCAQKDVRISKLINVPEGNKIFGAITLGYPKYKYKNWVIRKSPVISWS